MQTRHRFAIATTLAALPFAGSAQEIYVNPISPAMIAQYHDVVPPQVLTQSVPVDEDEDRKAPPENSDQALACFTIAGEQQCAPEEQEVAVGLIARGPSGISLDDPQKPSVTGFVRDHWPVVVDFAPEPGTMTVLKVRLYHRRWFLPFLEVADRQVIDFNSTGSRRIAVVPVLELPETRANAASSGVRVASYSIRSYRLRDGVPERKHGSLVRAPVEVFGIGAGPHAVGSFTLRKVTFEPPAVRIPPQGEKPFIARYSYVLDRDFDLVTATLARCGQVCKESSKPLASPPPFHGTWTGNWLVDSAAKPSDYAIVIRAWLNCGGASAADQVRACGDQAAWAFGRAKPVTLTK